MPLSRRARVGLALAVTLPALAGCDASLHLVAARIGAGVADTTFALRVGQEVRVDVQALRIAFLAVDNDSRCPSDVVCVWEGNAAVRIGVTSGTGPTVLHVLNTTLDPRAVSLGTWLLTLVRLDPYPVSTSRIPVAKYVATFRLQRVGYGPD